MNPLIWNRRAEKTRFIFVNTDQFKKSSSLVAHTYELGFALVLSMGKFLCFPESIFAAVWLSGEGFTSVCWCIPSLFMSLLLLRAWQLLELLRSWPGMAPMPSLPLPPLQNGWSSAGNCLGASLCYCGLEQFFVSWLMASELPRRRILTTIMWVPLFHVCLRGTSSCLSMPLAYLPSPLVTGGFITGRQYLQQLDSKSVQPAHQRCACRPVVHSPCCCLAQVAQPSPWPCLGTGMAATLQRAEHSI